jgi:undecaprenyl-diphosphatase
VTVLEAVALGVTQGVTEFLPISSDGHMALVYAAIGEKPDLSFEIFLHAATLLAMLVYFRSDIATVLRSLLPSGSADASSRRLAYLIAVGTVASGVIALLIEPFVEPMAASLTWVSVWFLVTSGLMAIAETFAPRLPRLASPEDLGIGRTTFIGVLQGAAVLPGLSRSGSTISAGMLAGLDREPAARFSFLLGIPIITLATVRDLSGLFTGRTVLPPPLVSIAGFVAAAVAGYLAISFLLAIVRHHSLYWFSAYTAVLGIAILVWSITTGGG